MIHIQQVLVLKLLFFGHISLNSNDIQTVAINITKQHM